MCINLIFFFSILNDYISLSWIKLLGPITFSFIDKIYIKYTVPIEQLPLLNYRTHRAQLWHNCKSVKCFYLVASHVSPCSRSIIVYFARNLKRLLIDQVSWITRSQPPVQKKSYPFLKTVVPTPGGRNPEMYILFPNDYFGVVNRSDRDRESKFCSMLRGICE